MTDLAKYTEQAISLLDGKLPALVWLPPSIRKKPRVTPDGVVTKNDPEQAEQLKRIAAADPIGFLIAIMNGQPIVTFRLTKVGGSAATDAAVKKDKRRAPRVSLGEDKGVEIEAEYHAPSVSDRERVATFLAQFLAGPATRQRFKQRGARSQEGSVGTGDDETDAMFANAAARYAGEDDGEAED